MESAISLSLCLFNIITSHMFCFPPVHVVPKIHSTSASLITLPSTSFLQHSLPAPPTPLPTPHHAPNPPPPRQSQTRHLPHPRQPHRPNRPLHPPRPALHPPLPLQLHPRPTANPPPPVHLPRLHRSPNQAPAPNRRSHQTRRLRRMGHRGEKTGGRTSRGFQHAGGGRAP